MVAAVVVMDEAGGSEEDCQPVSMKEEFLQPEVLQALNDGGCHYGMAATCLGKEMSEVKDVSFWAEQMNDPVNTKPEAGCWWLLCEDSLTLQGTICTVMTFGSSKGLEPSKQVSHATPPQPLDQHGDSCVLICAHGQASGQVLIVLTENIGESHDSRGFPLDWKICATVVACFLIFMLLRRIFQCVKRHIFTANKKKPAVELSGPIKEKCELLDKHSFADKEVRQFSK
ncbi:uncharacterized protein LOC121164571 [Ochotona curzoniae]|uniref:uncharacterized protein LOC121164571 n=1 Tax=Ochotona curzoniae TaxID=130825 RepID=UPI001B346B71|nr:uncharacterized protein LOC121164571 [Ochotona curzoniae]